MRCVCLFSAWLETLFVHFFLQRWLCCFLIARWLWCKAVALISQASVQFTEACEINQKCGQRPNGGDKADDTVGNRVGGSGGDQLAATRPTCCWSCWQSLYSYPHYGIPGTISPTIVAMFFGPKLARQGVGGCRDLPQWTMKALPAWTRDWNMSRSNVQWVRTSPWVPSEMPPICWPLVNTMGTSMLWTRCPDIVAILTWTIAWLQVSMATMPGHLVQSMLVPIVLTRGQQNDVILNFDDDDLYANKYVEYMVTQMQRRNLVAVTLSGWHNFFEARGSEDIRNPNHGIQKMKMKWMRSSTAMVLAMCTFA